MIKNRSFIPLALSICFGILISAQSPVMGEEKKSALTAADLEKEKATKNPYPNDLGPDKIDVTKYSPALRKGYKLMQDKCTKCHTASRVLNSQFVEIKGPALAAAKKNEPRIFKNKLIWQVEAKIWQRYVRRMMAKPGCGIAKEEGKQIWKFVVEYSKRRKTGKSAARWKKHRQKLLADFKEEHPDRYSDLFEEDAATSERRSQE